MPARRPVVCVVGAGPAGLEAVLAAREALGPEADLRLIAPDREFRYRPMSPVSPFGPTEQRTVSIVDLVAHAGATWVADRAAAVFEAERTVLTHDGDTVAFDFLLLAPGAQAGRALRQGHLWELEGDPSFLAQTIREISAGEVRSVAVVVPRGARWPLPAYEIALILAWATAEADARIALITAEERLLGALGPAATEAVTRELDAAGVETMTGVEVIDDPRPDPEPLRVADVIIVPEEPAYAAHALIGEPTDPARVRLGAGSVSEFDRLISLPTVVGPFIAGVPTDAAGFVEVDEALQVCDSERVWAAGGCIAAALEHSALAARQADAAIAAIAAAGAGDAGAGLARPAGPELTGILLTGRRDQWLAENPVGTRDRGGPATRCLWWPPGRAVGPRLARWIAARDPAVHSGLLWHPGGLVVRVPVALRCGGGPSARAGEEASAEVRIERLRDIETRQLLAVQQGERAAAAELRALSVELQTLSRNEREVVRELQQHGYLRHRDESATSRKDGRRPPTG